MLVVEGFDKDINIVAIFGAGGFLEEAFMQCDKDWGKLEGVGIAGIQSMETRQRLGIARSVSQETILYGSECMICNSNSDNG